MKIATGLAIILAACAVAPAASAEWNGRGFAGPGFFELPHGNVYEVPVIRFQPSYDSGGFIGGAVGMLHPEGWRFEGEVTRRRNEIDRIRIGAAELGGNGRVSATTFMGNVFYEFATQYAFRPYAGGGIGLLRARHDGMTVMGAAIAADESSTEFAFQVGGGVAVDVVKNVDITIDYRFMRANDPEFERVDAEYRDHSVTLGLRWRF